MLSDPTAMQIARDWGRKPWLDDLRLKLADRLLEMDRPATAAYLRDQGVPDMARHAADGYHKHIGRRALQRRLRSWQSELTAILAMLGVHDTIPCVTSADTPGGDDEGIPAF